MLKTILEQFEPYAEIKLAHNQGFFTWITLENSKYRLQAKTSAYCGTPSRVFKKLESGEAKILRLEITDKR